MAGSVSASTIAIGGLALSAAGTGMSMIGQANQAQASATAANYQAQIARNNQQIMQQNAAYDQQRGDIAEQNSRLKTAQVIGSQRAALASQGGDINSGSPLDIQGDAARAGETDALTIRSNTARAVWNDNLQGMGYGNQASLLSMNAANSMASLPYGIGSTLLGGASSTASNWLKYKQAFPGTPSPSTGSGTGETY
jgi:hypothetical protein